MTADPFRIRDHVPEFDSIVEEIARLSASARQTIPMIGDVAYGDGPSETLDIFFPEGPRRQLPVHMFIHGGYWRMFSKNDYSYVAQAVTAAGAIAVILDYALMPKARLDVLVDQTRRASRWVSDNIAGHGGDPARFSVSGHSAGAHLASFLLHRGTAGPRIRRAMLLGGLFDLKPLRGSFLQQEIALTDEEVERFTPLDQSYDPDCHVTIAVGGDETPPFHTQARQFAEKLGQDRVSVSSISLPRQNHMSSVRDLGLPGNPVSDLILKTIAAT